MFSLNLFSMVRSYSIDSKGNKNGASFNMDAYSKKTLMAKLFWDIADNQELRLSYTANRSDDVLYPSTPMDALYDDSDIYNMEYIAKDLGTYSKELNLQVYQSEVDHPMSTRYRIMSDSNTSDGIWDSQKAMTHALTTKTQGIKLKKIHHPIVRQGQVPTNSLVFSKGR